MNPVEKLSNIFGLSEYESAIYAALVTNGPQHVSNVGKYSNIPRTAIYPPLKNLLAKGLASETSFGKRKYYSAIPTENLRTLFEEKRSSLEDVLLELNRSTNISSKNAKLDVTLYSGPEGIKSAGLIFMEETKEKLWYSFENLSQVADSVGFEFEDFYIKERVKRKIFSKVIFSMKEETPALRRILREDKDQLRETIAISPNQYPFDSTVAVTKSLVLLVNPNQNQFALLIRNPFLANTFMSIHKVIWERYK